MQCSIPGCENKRMNLGGGRFRKVCQKHHRETFKIKCPDCGYVFTKKELKKSNA